MFFLDILFHRMSVMGMLRQIGVRLLHPPSVYVPRTPPVYQERDNAIAESAAEQKKRPIHVMSAEVCNGGQNPKRQSEPAKKVRSDT